MDASSPHYCRYQHFDPFRPLDWRWQFAQALVASGRRIRRQRLDLACTAALDYLRALGRCRTPRGRERLNQSRPGLQAALQLADADSDLRYEVQATILAGQDDATVAARCGLDPVTVHWYEALHYCVRDRLSARDWIADSVLGPCLWFGCGERDLREAWPAFGYFGGVDALDVVLAVSRGRGLSALLVKLTGTSGRATDEARLRASAKLALAAMRIPPELPLLQAAELRELAQRAQDAQQETPGPTVGAAAPPILDALANALASATRAAATASSVA